MDFIEQWFGISPDGGDSRGRVDISPSGHWLVVLTQRAATLARLAVVASDLTV
jgi:hypothetical protein